MYEVSIEQLNSLTETCQHIDDPRTPINILHPVENIVSIAIAAILAGSEGPKSIALGSNETGVVENLAGFARRKSSQPRLYSHLLWAGETGTVSSLFCELDQLTFRPEFRPRQGPDHCDRRQDVKALL